jgi:hypothetical protein
MFALHVIFENICLMFVWQGARTDLHGVYMDHKKRTLNRKLDWITLTLGDLMVI